MKKSNLKFFIAFVFVLTLCISPYAKADWDEGDPHKMHYPQLPKALEGWDVALFSEGSIWLADDWKCSQTGPVSDIHFWVSWRYDDVQPIDAFSIRIWSDNPFGPNGWSEPNELLWERDFYAGDFTVRPMPPEQQGWFDPYRYEWEPIDHTQWAQVNITDINQPHIQQEGEVYWLMIDVWAGGIIGWKQSGSPQFRDDAVYYNGFDWIELRDPITTESMDLAFVITGENLDFGDAPDPTYPTFLASNGARHVIGGPWMGDGTDVPDPEPDGQPVPPAAGDDLDGNDDEDGLTVPTLTAGQAINFPLQVNDTAGVGGIVEIWVDYNIDGDWDDAGELTHSAFLPVGINAVTINVPAAAVPGMTFARGRISSAGTGSPRGQAPDGEVEDTEVYIELPPEFDFGDAPDPTYPTLLANDGARHIVPTVITPPHLGNSIDTEADGQPNATATGDDNDGNDDEDGVTLDPIMPATVVNAYITPSADGFINAWIDYKGDGDWDDIAERIFTDYPVTGGVVNICPFGVPFYAQPGIKTFARFRYTTYAGGAAPISYTGLAQDGEVEDYMVDIEENPAIKWIQLPDGTPNGIDIKVNDMQWIADDFECTTYGLITDVHLWGSWKDDIVGEIERIHLSIHSDDPVGPGGSDPDNEYSKPDELLPALWERDFYHSEFTVGAEIYLEDGEYWWDPLKGDLIPEGDHTVQRIDIDIPESEAFLQEGSTQEPVIYWLDVQVETDPDIGGEFGWKTRKYPEHFMDDAVFDFGSELPREWKELRYPPEHPYHPNSIDMAFVLTGKELKPPIKHLKWSQPPIENDPMLETPYYCGWNEESWTQDPCEVIPGHSVVDDFRCIGSMPVTSIHFWGSFIGWDIFEPPLIQPTDWEFKFYANVPADSSADPNYSHPGNLLWKVIVPNDRVFTEWKGYDEYPEMPFESCFQHYVDLQPEEYFLQNEYLEDTNDNIYWLGIRAVYPNDVDIEYPWGWKTRPESWMDDAVTHECRTVGWEVDPDTGELIPIVECRYWPIEDPIFGLSFDVAFELDTDPNYIKWEQPFTGIRNWPHYEDRLSMANIEQWTEQITKWSQKPDLEDINSLDIDATIEQTWKPQVLADDFPCEITGPITNIDVWGSWYHDHPPFMDANAVTFTLSIHRDIPAIESPTGYSIPGALLWKKEFFPGEFNVWEYEYTEEGWFVPCAEPPAYDSYADNICFQYSFSIDPCDAFTQEVGNIYWLDVQAKPVFWPEFPEPVRFGWKNSWYEWNDDAVWAVGEDPPLGQWNELIYPPGHPRAGESINLAFAIYTNFMNKWEQPPELQSPVSIDIDATKEEVWKPQVLADDFQCTDPEPITDIHIWASWYHDFQPYGDANNVTFTLSIHDDLPIGDPENPFTYSLPGDLLWTKKFQPGDFDCSIYARDINEGWFVPCGEPPYYEEGADFTCWQYDFYINRDEAFPQQGSTTNPVTYWLDVQAQPNTSLAGEPPEPIRSRLGWKTSQEKWNDDAVWAVGQDPPTEPWNELRYPTGHPLKGDSIDLAFEITGEIVHEEFVINKLVADDWLCERRTPVTAVVWFGSYLNYIYETPCSGIIQPPPTPPDHFLIAIYKDIPADYPDNEYPFSHPGRKLWQYAAYDYDEVLVGYDKYPEHTSGPREPVYRYSVRLPEDKWFRQREIDDVYWISIMAVYKSDVTLNHEGWGWTIHEYVFGDDAVQGYWSTAAPDEWVWEEILDQNKESADMSFILFTDPNECVNCADYNWDDIVNFYDYAIFALDWMWTGPAGGYANGDLNCNGKVDFEDLEIYCNQWLDSCPP